MKKDIACLFPNLGTKQFKVLPNRGLSSLPHEKQERRWLPSVCFKI